MTVTVGGLTTAQLVGSVKGLGALLLEHGQTRIELLRVELAEERGRLGRSVAHGAVLCFLSFLTVELGMLAVAGLYWDGPHRMHAMVAMLGLSLLATAITYAGLRRRRRRHAQRLNAVAAELKNKVAEASASL